MPGACIETAVTQQVHRGGPPTCWSPEPCQMWTLRVVLGGSWLGSKLHGMLLYRARSWPKPVAVRWRMLSEHGEMVSRSLLSPLAVQTSPVSCLSLP